MSEETKRKRKFKFPLWAKTLAVLVISVAIVSGVSIGFFSSTIRTITRNHYTEHAVELSDTLGVYLDVDNIKAVKAKVESIYNSIPEEEKVENSSWGEPEWEEYLTKYDEVVEMPEYQALFDQLVIFHSKNDVKFLSIGYADLVKQRFVYLVDDSEPDERCLPGSFDAFTENDMTIYDHYEEGFYPEITNMPEYGYLASTARPIFDDSHEVVGFAMVDLSMDSIMAKERENTRNLIIILVSLSVGTVLIGSLLVIILIARPVRILTHAANEYANSEDEQLNKFAQIKINTKDEIEDLANSMKKMETDINRYIVDLLGAERKAAEMKHLADKDALTGMNNKRSYFEIEERLNDVIKKGSAKFAISMIDLNDLKGINDSSGHEKGDEAIVILANIINETFKNSSTYRIGGDEFVAVSEGKDLENIHKLEKEFRKNISAKTETLSAAIGVAIFDPKTDNNFEDTFKRADAIMYQHKKEMKSK